jgi:hypothetical protein
MVDRTSGETSFNLDLNNLVEDAFERCGAELRTGYDLRTARRSLNLLTIEWANRGINLWTVEPGQITLNQNQIMYALPSDTIDLLDISNTLINYYPFLYISIANNNNYINVKFINIVNIIDDQLKFVCRDINEYENKYFYISYELTPNINNSIITNNCLL